MVSKLDMEPMRMFTALPPLLCLKIFLYLSSALTQRVVAQIMIRCIESERHALLDFKQDLVDDYGILSSWGSDVHQRECCNWWGVYCSNNTGHVTVLDLHPRLDDYGYPVEQHLRGRKVSPSLLGLKHLNYLDLSYNDFQWSPIPEFIGSFQSLRVLSLMDANFSGTIPPQLGNLTNLRILNVTGFSTVDSSLSVKNLEWLSLLSSLKYFVLNGVQIDLSESPEISVNLPPSLEELHLQSCGLFGTLPFSLNSSSPSLSIVDFSYNNLIASRIFHLLRNATQLTAIDLSENNFEGPIPDTFREMKFLENLNLGANSFTNGVPKSLGNLTHLVFLSLNGNQLNETIAELIEKLSEGASKSLQTLQLSQNKLIGAVPDISTKFPSLRELDISENQLNGSFPLNFGLPSSIENLDFSLNKIGGLFQDNKGFEEECDLVYLDLSNNQITGSFPDLSHFSSLRKLYLSGNRLQGGFPETIGKLSKLQVLDASSNSLEGVITEAHFLNLTNIQMLDLSFNAALSFNLTGNWVPPFQLSIISLANCKMGPQFPKWLQNQRSFSVLDISVGGISDMIPNWFWNLSATLQYLNLSYNNIGGRLPDLSTKFMPSPLIDLSSNNFSGPIPLFPQNFKILHLSNNKFHGSISFVCSIIGLDAYSIDLSDNQLSGEIPDCWNSSLNLRFLNFANNHLFGKVPNSFGSLIKLESLYLRNNKFVGELPSSLQNCTSLRLMDFGENKFTGRIPLWIGRSLTNLLIVSFRHNKFYGNIPSSVCHLKLIRILDLSQNKLTGRIPQCFSNFTSLIQNNISIGSISIEFGIKGGYFAGYMNSIVIQWKYQDSEYRRQLGLVYSIDLSSNQLRGDIPKELSSMRALISLNLSRNHLTGKIFQTIYQMENLESLDLSRNQLSGEIPIGLARLNFLAVLDLSNNFLSGKIPTSTQLQSFNASSYAGNSGLCGDPLPKCLTDFPPQNKNEDFEEGDNFLDQGFYISMMLGFFFGFWGIVAMLVLKGSWRSAYYGFLNDIKDWLHAKMKFYLVKLQGKLTRTHTMI